MSIRKREWQTQKGESRTSWVVDYRDAGGNRRNKQFDRKKDADAFNTRANWEVRQGTHTADSQSITVEAAGKNWLARGRREGLEESTLDPYDQHLRLHILPQLGGRRLNQLTKPMVEDFRDWLLDNGRSRALAKKVLGSLRALIKEAERTGYVSQNVATGVTVKRSGRERPQVVPPTKEQIRKLLDGASNPKARPMDRPLMMVFVFTGLRASEARGLSWRNVDLKAGTISIDQRADRKNSIGPPKSKSGFRTIPMPPSLVTELKAWKLRCKPSALNLVFPSEVGTPIFHANLVLGFQEPVQLRAGLSLPKMKGGKPVVDEQGSPIMEGQFGLHDLRHACASLWIEQQVVPKRVQNWMGHHSIQVTYDVYGHLFEAADQDASVMAAIEADILGTA